MKFACVVFGYLAPVALTWNLKGIFRFASWIVKAEVYDNLVAVRGNAAETSEESQFA